MPYFNFNGRTFIIAERENRFRLRWTINKKRHEKTFKTLKAAKDYARNQAQHAPGSSMVLEDKEIVEYLWLQKQIPEEATLQKIVTLGIQAWHDTQEVNRTKQISVMELVELFLNSKPKSEEYKRVFKIYIGKFARVYQIPIKEITPQNVQTYLDNLQQSTKTIYQASGYLKTLFGYAIENKYYPSKNLNWEVARPVKEEVSIYTIDEAKQILNVWPIEYLATVAIQMFAGLRASEVQNLEWEQITEDGIVILAKHSKTKRRRVAPMLPNLAQWLKHVGWKESGPVVPPGKVFLSNRNYKLSKRLEIAWKKNALRHSFCSYRLAATKDAAATAYEAGHSVVMQQQNYDAVVTHQEGLEWFEMVPE